MTSPRSIAPAVGQLDAPAKLTWYLEILGRRDDGYHDLRSEMLSISLVDHLTIDGDRDGPVEMIAGTPRCHVDVPDGDNLVSRALAFMERRAAVRVLKRIPSGGGLGGGSSDAGAVLWWAGLRDASAAVKLGGDVPFCVRGGRALVEGVGDRLAPLEYVERTVTLFVPEFTVSTAACYAAWDQMRNAGERSGGRNHLAAAACLVEPRLATALAWTAAELGREATVCGSGSTFFVEGSVEGLDGTSTLVTPIGGLTVHHVSTMRSRDLAT